VTPDELRAAYDTWHAGRDVDASSDAPWHQLLKAHVSDVGGRRVLEIGCGRGGFAVWLAELPVGRRPAEIVASDLSDVALEKARAFARARGIENVHHSRGDLMALEWPSASFDAIFSCETIEHVVDPRVALAELARVLRPGGALYLTFPNYLNLLGAHRIYRELTGRPCTEEGQPINHFLLLPRVLVWLRRTGLRVETVAGVGHYVPFPRRPPERLGFLDGRAPTWLSHHPLVIARR
jgi:SAM-dependent methyltransferase